MKVAELRDTIANYNEEQLKLVIVELYKAIPKKIKEEKGIDDIVTLQSTGPKRKKQKRRELREIADETEEFIDDAYNQYYFAPNSVIHKKDRPKWRFIVRRLYKELVAWTNDEPELVSNLLEQLYRLLCYASSYLLFSSDDPFASIMIEKSDFFNTVVQAKLKKGHDEATIREILELALGNDYGYLYSWEAASIVAASLKTPPLKELALDQVKILMKKQPHNKKQKKWQQDLIIMGCTLYISLYEYETAISFFKKNYLAKPEEKVFLLLRLLENWQMTDLWIREYEEAEEKKILQRSDLRRQYEALKKEIG